MWKQLDISDLRKLLSEDECTTLDMTSAAVGLDRIQAVLDLVSDTWRGAIRAKGFTLYARDHWTPSTLHYWILVHARYAVWTSFPMSPVVALDEARTKEYEKALEILGDIPFAVDLPDYSEDPELSGKVDQGESLGASIFVPFQRLDKCINYWKNPIDFPISR